MPKIKKVHRKKKFRVNVNRKRLRNKLNKRPAIQCQVIKEAWDNNCSTIKNLEQMGIAYDVNQVLKVPNVKKEMLKSIEDGVSEEENNGKSVGKNLPKKVQVVKSLEEEAKWPRARLFRLPNNEVHFATYMMDKYGDDYEAMVRDRKNFYQMTACQIRRKIERFKSIPEQYAEYLVKKGEIILEDPAPLKKLKPEILKEPLKKNPKAKLSKRQKQKSLMKATWTEESIEDIPLVDYNKTLNEPNEIMTQKQNCEKKLQLFPDEDEDDSSDVKNTFIMSDNENSDKSDENSKSRKVKKNENLSQLKIKVSKQSNKKKK